MEQYKIFPSACEKSKPREVVYKAVTEELGGLSSCVSLGQLPRSRQQVMDMGDNVVVKIVCRLKTFLGEEEKMIHGSVFSATAKNRQPTGIQRS